MSLAPTRSSLMEKFRSDRKRLPLHPLEKTVLTVLCIHLCFLPWAFGTMQVWSQATSLGLAIIGLIIALIPRQYTSEYSGGPEFRLSAWPKLLKFPLFWIGLALMIYLLIQGFNPSWRFESNEKSWWLRKVPNIAWLPTSIDTPFARVDLWRKFIIYSAAWLLVCTLWIGLTRKRSLQILLTVLVSNACILSLAGGAQHLWFPRKLLGIVTVHPMAIPFASFVGHNHAGAYLALIMGCALLLAVVMGDQKNSRMEKSSPASVFALAAIFLFGALLVTTSRGAVLTAALFSSIFTLWFWFRRRVQPKSASNIFITLVLAVLVGAVALFTIRHLDLEGIQVKFARLLEQQSKEESTRQRFMAHESAKRMLDDHWVRGVGAGGFEYLFPGYIKKHPTAYNGGKTFWQHAHNDWLQFPIELGLAGCLILLAGAGAVVVFFARQKLSWLSPVVVLLIGCGQTLGHAWFDFPFQCPAILGTWCVLIAVAMRWAELESAAEGARSRGAAQES